MTITSSPLNLNNRNKTSYIQNTPQLYQSLIAGNLRHLFLKLSVIHQCKILQLREKMRLNEQEAEVMNIVQIAETL